MTVFIASLFLPYTIDFKSTGLKSVKPSLRRKSSPSYAAVDGSGSVPIIGRLADTHKPRQRSTSLELTPGATTEDEKVFKAYVSHSAGEIQFADDPNGPGPNEPRAVPWGQSRKFNQPRSKAIIHPEPSILSRPASRQESKESPFLNGGGVLPPAPPEIGSPRALLSAEDWVVKAAEQGNGGLHNAINAAADADLLENKMWVGTPGMPTDSLTDMTRHLIDETLRTDYESLTVFVGDSEFEGHYTHFCRSVLWPALHYQMQESPRHTEYDDYSWRQYLKVNEAFANTIANHWRPGDTIWVHDYHLLVLPALLRKKLPRARIGFFLHSAFPSSEVFRCLNSRDALLDGLLGADLIGFQTEEYCYHFIHTCSRLRQLQVLADGVQVNHRFVRVKNYPLGIDYKSLNALRQSVEVKDWISNIDEKYRGKHLIVARDRLDAPGGIKQKLLAYELFLQSYPKWRENVVLVQVASSASEIPELEAQVSKVAMRINSVHSTLTHSPLVLLKQDISYSQFLALLSVAEVYMVTNLREGMNLTSHDFVHCQDGQLASQKHGSLILSEFTGSASIFHGHELLVNPWDYKQCADAINHALEMSPEQRQKNWEFLLDRKAPHTALAWFSSIQSALTEAHSMQQSRETHAVTPLHLGSLKESYQAAQKRIFFLEDGATFIPDEAHPSKEATDLIQALVLDPKNTVYLTSKNSPDQLDETARVLSPRIGLIAENGCFAKPSPKLTCHFSPEETEQEPWEALVDVTGTSDWRAGIRKVIEYFQERTEGSTIEERRCSLTFDYTNALDRDIAAHQASELADQINGARGSEAIRVVRDTSAVSVEPLHASKASAASMLLDRLPADESPDFIFVAGGARGDESLFRWANQATHVKTVNGHSNGNGNGNGNANGNEYKARTVTTVTAGTHATEASAILPTGLSLLDVLRLLVFPHLVDVASRCKDRGV
ncbi:Alpha-alpha-trehalose phosphate synthase subunit [Penicillium verhagenii]|uniref:Alpha-alpha-trehalose phosphate synthase subunit n=1 Tax=Penicillium verhagenii TaxID=1562060 RepID=UPI002545B6FB|nr:Alpha-alpha-trehalose phosphate synthase subunit [Penicillium verhagenii]KAJ5947802.1 Alpha-alpha-trehalose phosphate synthase subunit [Penicillium verhagenii]